MSDVKRRDLLKKAFTVIGATGLTMASAKAGVCRLTSAQPEGPFYPIVDQNDKDSDLTQVQGRTKKAIGEVVILKGLVLDQECKPIPGVLVEIWQACESGKYNHPGDPNRAKLDPNFQYWGRAISNKKGEYSFKTIKPGLYRATADWERPPHIHMKVHLRGFEELTTQVYFSENKVLNSKDRLLRSLSSQDRKSLIVEFKQTSQSELRVGEFNINLKRL